MSGTNHNPNKKLYFIRHGESELNVAGRFAGHTETPLTDEGRRQAKQAGAQAKELGIDYIISSPLERTIETAQIIAEEIDYPFDKIQIDNLLIERDCGTLEGQIYIPGFDFSTVANAESDEQLKERAKKALQLIEAVDAQTILIVSHGGMGRALRFYAEPAVPFQKQLLNGHLYHWN